MRTGAIRGIRLELKKAYRKNMALGFGLSSAAVVMLAAVILLLSAGEIPGDNLVGDTPQVLPLPPPIIFDPGPGPVTEPPRPQPPKPSVGIPVPVPDSEVGEDVLLPSQFELYLQASAQPGDGQLVSAAGFGSEPVPEEILPPPDRFVAFEEAPILVESVDPIYPDLARRAGIEGHVWLKVLIDRRGAVRDALVASESNENAGFGEAAVAAARKCVWRPAIANGQPTAVWVTYKVQFKLRK